MKSFVEIADSYSERAQRLANSGDLEAADRCARRGLALAPTHGELLGLLASVLVDRGDSVGALCMLRGAVDACPAQTHLVLNLARLLRRHGDLRGAIRELQAARRVSSDPELSVELAMCFREIGEGKRGAELLRETLPGHFDRPDVWLEMSRTALGLGEYAQAGAAAKAARGIGGDTSDLDYLEGMSELQRGNARRALRCLQRLPRAGVLRAPRPLLGYARAAVRSGRCRAALGACERALALSRAAEVVAECASTLLEAGLFARSEEAIRSAIRSDAQEARPDWRFTLALLLLLRGDYEEGLDLYERRLRFGDLGREFGKLPDDRLWSGQPLAGKHLLICTEQGGGDTIQFMRFVPKVGEETSRLSILGAPSLQPILESSFPGAHCVSSPSQLRDDWDFHVAMGSLAHRLGVRRETIDAPRKYINVDRFAAARFAEFTRDGTPRIGVAWHGNPNHQLDYLRSMKLGEMAPLLRVGGVQWVSLQIGSGHQELGHDRELGHVLDVTHKIKTYADTAGLVSHLDLVITVDTSVAHLAAAMGKPTWILLSTVPDWRWGLAGEESAWYPTARLFRQPTRGRWEDIIARVRNEVTQLFGLPGLDRRRLPHRANVKGPEAHDEARPEQSTAAQPAPRRIRAVLHCEGLGDTLYSIPVLRKLHGLEPDRELDVYTHHPALFAACPFVATVQPIHDRRARSQYADRTVDLFDVRALPFHRMHTIDFVSIPLGLGQLSFAERQLEYFPSEEDTSDAFDVVLNTSITWPTRSWPIENWQHLADELRASGHSVAVVGKDVYSHADGMHKRSPTLLRCTDLTNRLSLDQTFNTIQKTRVFVSCQNGLSVLSGATDTEIVVLDQSIEWSKRAIFRKENPHYKVTYVRGDCDVYCALSHECALESPEGNFCCIPPFERVRDGVFRALARTEEPNR